MRLPMSLLAAALFAALPLSASASAGLDADDLATAAELREQAQRGNAAWQLVESLTTEVGPRLAGTDADARAVAWANMPLEQFLAEVIRDEGTLSSIRERVGLPPSY